MATKFKIKKFGVKNKFGLWQIKVRVVLAQYDLDQTVNIKEAKSVGVTDTTWKKIEQKELSTLHLLLIEKALCNVVGESAAMKLWKKLEDLYITSP